jgi:hypothetical protein
MLFGDDDNDDCVTIQALAITIAVRCRYLPHAFKVW